MHHEERVLPHEGGIGVFDVDFLSAGEMQAQGDKGFAVQFLIHVL